MKNFSTTIKDMTKKQVELLFNLNNVYNVLDPINTSKSTMDDFYYVSECIDFIHSNRYMLLDEKLNDWRIFITKGLSMMINVFLQDISCIEINKSTNPMHNTRITRSMAANHMKIKFNYIKMQENLIKKVKEISQTSQRKSSRIASIPA